jgi:chromate transporter
MDPLQVRLWDIFLYFLKLGTFGFGGPVALVGYMQRDLVERDRWVSQGEFSQGVALAATLPGPLAAQVAMWIGYLKQGFWGCTVASIGLIGPPFLIVLILAAIYVRFEEASWIRALFYGIGPAVAALIAEACYHLSRRYVTDWKMIVLALACLLVTVIVQAELAILFIAGGLIGVLIYAPPRWKSGKPAAPTLRMFAGISVAGLFGGWTLSKLGELALFFFKAGAFTFGSGLAVAPFIHQGLVIENHWLTERQFLDTVAMGMITPGPVVIMSTFAGYLIDGFRGAVVASIAVFLPIYLMVVFAASYFVRHRDNPIVSGFVKGATTAAVGSISGAGIIIASGVIIDWLTAVIAVLGLVLIMRWKIPGLAIVIFAGLIGFLFHQ